MTRRKRNWLILVSVVSWLALLVFAMNNWAAM